MSFAAACDWSLTRSLLLAAMAWPACWWLERNLRSSRRPMLWLWLLVSPFLFPELLLGYLFAPWTVGRPWRAEVFCFLVLLVRSLPIGVIALRNVPTADVSPAALYLRRLKLQSVQDFWQLCLCYWYGPLRRVLPALGLMFLVTFQEFEAAALSGAVSWTDKLFMDYATGLSLGESTRYLVRPLIMQLAVLSMLGWSLWRRAGGDSALDREPGQPIDAFNQRVAEIVCLLMFLTGVVLPLFLLTRQLSAGWMWLWTQSSAVKSLATEMATSGLVALVAGLAAFCVPLFVLRDPWLGPLARNEGEGTEPDLSLWIVSPLVLPGLCGGLTLSLAALSVTSGVFPVWLAATPLAWLVASILWLLPRSFLLQTWLMNQSEPAAVHLIELLKQSPCSRQRAVAGRWWWQWQIEPQIAIVGVMCYWAYLDLTVAAILHPPGMTPVMVRLYNFMHFGHSAAMSMEAAVVMFLPVILWGLMMAVLRSICWGRR